MKKRLLSYLLCITILFGLILQEPAIGSEISPYTDTTNLTVTDSGRIDNVKWILYTNGLLEISGNGELPSYGYNESPWSKYKTNY